MEQKECSETSAYKIQTPENYPEESIQQSEHSESLNPFDYMLIRRHVNAVYLYTLSVLMYYILSKTGYDSDT